MSKIEAITDIFESQFVNNIAIAHLKGQALDIVTNPKSAPALSGGIALVTTLFGLFITSILVDDMTVGGISNWLAATLLVWVGALIAGMILPVVAFKKYLENR